MQSTSNPVLSGVPALAGRGAALVASGASIVAGALLTAMVVVVGLGVLSRELGVQLLQNHEEFAGYLMAAFAVSALPGSFHAGSFVRVDVLYRRLSGRPWAIVHRFFLFLALGYAVWLAWHSYELAARSLDYGSTSIGGTGVALAIPQGFVAAGLIVFAVYLLLRLVGHERPKQQADETRVV